MSMTSRAMWTHISQSKEWSVHVGVPSHESRPQSNSTRSGVPVRHIRRTHRSGPADRHGSLRMRTRRASPAVADDAVPVARQWRPSRRPFGPRRVKTPTQELRQRVNASCLRMLPIATMAKAAIISATTARAARSHHGDARRLPLLTTKDRILIAPPRDSSVADRDLLGRAPHRTRNHVRPIQL